MLQKPRRTRCDQVAAEVRSRIDGCQFTSTGMLPPVRQLALEHATSQVTVIAALRLLQREGIIHTYRGKRGYFLKSASEPVPAGGVSKRLRAVEIADDLRKRILEGEFHHSDVLPSVKSLISRYHCSSKTAARVIDILVKRAFLTRSGKTCRIAMGPSRSRHASAVYLANEPQIALHENLHVDLFLRAIEDGIAARGWAPLRYLMIDEKGADRYTLRELPPFADIAGFIHLAVRKTAGWWKFFGEHPDKPVSAVLPHAPNTLAPWIMDHPLVSFIMPDNYAAGATVGAHLAGRGHRSVAFFTGLGQAEPWVTSRIAGLRESVGGSRLAVFAREPQGGGAGGYQLVSPQAADCAPAVEARRVQSRVTGLNDIVSDGVRMKDSFAEALEMGCTAWVCVNDNLMLSAKAFLDKKGIRVPDRVSLCGFDNNLLSYVYGLTSYDFRYDRIGSVALQWLAEPHTLRLSPDKTLRLAGTLRERASTVG